MSSVARIALVATVLASAVACGGSKPAAVAPKNAARHQCGEHDKVHTYDLHDEDGQDHFVPCAQTGREDFSGKVRFETTSEGILVIIEATDDDYNEGKLGSEVKGRDAVIVYPKGPGTQGVEVPLEKTESGYKGQKLIPFDDLPTLTDEGSKIDVHIYDHDDDHKDGAHEQLKVSVAISAGKSCEKARDENPDEVVMGKKGSRDLTAEELGRPMATTAFINHCRLPDSANAEICVAVKKGKPLGVSVKVSPQNNKLAACIDRATRKLAFPRSDKLDIVKQTF